MTINLSVPRQLETLTTLYQKGYHSDLIEQSLTKIINLELHHAKEQSDDLESKLLVFENQYQMDSEQFYQKFITGTLGDAIDFVEWSIFYEMWQAIQERIKLLDSADKL